MGLLEYVDRYLVERPGLSRDYCRLLTATATKLCAWADRPLALADVDRAMLGRWATALLLADRPSTVNDKLRMVRTLLLAAYDDDLLEKPPKRVRKLPEYLSPPQAWTIEECRRLFVALARAPGTVGDVPAADWWSSLCLTVYWTAVRIGALLRAETQDYWPGEGLTVTRQKNGRQQWYSLPPSCCEAVERVLPESGPIWLWPYHKNTLWHHFRGYVEAARLPAPKAHCQLFYRLRRTNLSYCAAEDPAIAQRQADHASLETTRRHYLDPRIARQRSAADVLPDPTPQKPRLRVIG